MEHAFKNGETAVITFPLLLSFFSLSLSLFSLSSISTFSCRTVIHSFIHSFIRSFVQSFTRFCVYTHFIHSFILCSIYSLHSLYNLPARCHSFTSLCCNFPSFSPVSSQPALLLPMWKSHFTAIQMVHLIPPRSAAQVPNKSLMAPLEVSLVPPTYLLLQSRTFFPIPLSNVAFFSR